MGSRLRVAVATSHKLRLVPSFLLLRVCHEHVWDFVRCFFCTYDMIGWCFFFSLSTT